MDIFTTQLTRVVPVPIKPASLKVKALLKEAANSKLNQDPDHLENHEYYFTADSDEYHPNQSNTQQETDEKQDADAATQQTQELAEPSDTTNDKPKHLDLYV